MLLLFLFSEKKLFALSVKNQNLRKKQKKMSVRVFILIALLFAGVLGYAGFFLVSLKSSHFDSPTEYLEATLLGKEESGPVLPVVTHIAPPEAVRAVYMTQCVAGTPVFRNSLVQLVEDTEINSIVIDVKDYSGVIGFLTDNPKLKPFVSDRCRASDIRSFIESLHQKNIYVIARITVFQDPLYASARPDLAVKRASDGAVWKDYKKISFIDVGAKEFWDYIIELSKESYNLGFDEINFDYIRFPSDGPMKDIYFPFSEKKIMADPEKGKAEILREFFSYLYDELKDTGMILSADLFGMTTTNTDDLNIGQILEYAVPYFDYIAPMVYPSHYPKGFNGYANVNLYPYEIVKFSMDSAVERINEMAMATTTDYGGRGIYEVSQLRPWIQDFDYPVTYTSEMVRVQKQAVYDSGLDSWMLWDPANIYTREALD